jgi:hypothetical protein
MPPAPLGIQYVYPPWAYTHQNQAPQLRDSHAADPKPFTGHDATKIEEFIASCILVFTAKPISFPDDPSRVNYAISYLSEGAGHWIRPILLLSPPHPMRGSWDLFVSGLNAMFGDPFKAATAERTLRNLEMKDSQHISKYIVEFSRHAPYTGWGSIPLGTQFYQGLPLRIKQGFRYRDRPRDLLPLQRVCAELDQYHWEVEKDLTGGSRKYSGHSGTTSAPAPTTPAALTAPKASAPVALNKAPEARKAIQGPTPDYVKKLTSDGHLSLSDRENRLANGLCLYCGIKGHSVASCPSIPDKKRRTPAGTSGRAVITLPVASPPTPELTASIVEVTQEKA